MFNVQGEPLALDVVVREARRHRAATLPPTMEMADVIAYGVVGLLEAHERFDASRNVPFMAFALPRIRGAMVEGIAAFSGVRRMQRRRIVQQAHEQGQCPRKAFEALQEEAAVFVHSNRPTSPEAVTTAIDARTKVRAVIEGLLKEGHPGVLTIFGRKGTTAQLSRSTRCRRRAAAIEAIRRRLRAPAWLV